LIRFADFTPGDQLFNGLRDSRKEHSFAGASYTAINSDMIGVTPVHDVISSSARNGDSLTLENEAI